MSDKSNATRRIAHVTTVHHVGDNRIFHKECISLAEAGYDVHLIAVTDNDSVREGVHINALPKRRSRMQRALRGSLDAWSRLREIKPDLIHVHDPELIPLAVAWRALHRRPAIYDAHEDLAKQLVDKNYIPRPLRALMRTVAKGLEFLADHGLSGIVVAEPQLVGNYRNRRKVMVQNFPWLRSFPEPDFTLPSKPTAVYVGGISEGRGAKEMLEAIRRSRTKPRLVLAGPVTPPSLEGAITADPEIVSYLGRIPVADIPGLVNGSTVGLCVLHPLPNYVDAQSTKLYEYMAAGRPFIASNFPSWVALLGSHDAGLFVDALDPVAIAEAIDLLVEDPSLALAMGKRGRAALTEHYTFERESQILQNFVGSLIGRP